MTVENSKPFFSIVVPCKNSVQTIERTIQSVLTQGVSLELIVVDGASTDGTLLSLEKYKDDIRVRIDSRPDTGIYAAMNRGIALSRGRYVGILNSDDAYMEGALVCVQEELKGGSDFCYGPVWWLNPKISERILTTPLKRSIWLSKGIQQMPAPHVGVFLKKEKYEAMGGYNEGWKIAADHEFLLRLAQSDCSSQEILFPIAELFSGGVSAGILAKWESFKIAMQYGQNPIFAIFVFFRQVLLYAILHLVSPSKILKWKANSRYQNARKGVE